MKTLTKSQLIKARFEVTNFYNKLSDTQKKECLNALNYSQIPIKELKENFSLTKVYKVATPLQRLKNKFVNIILSDLFIKAFIYLSAILFILLFSINI